MWCGRVCALGVLLVALVVPGAAVAGTWGWPVQGRIALGYGQEWTDAAGRSCTHGGVDVAAQSGAGVRACTDGTVTFAGRVPAAGGGTTAAVTVATPDGTRFTVMPLAAISVAAGDGVTAGDELGVLAASGDGSSPASHVHLGARRGEAAIDPLSLLASPQGGGPLASGPAAGERAPDPRPHAGTDIPAGFSPGRTPAPAGAPAVAPLPAPVRVAAPVPRQASSAVVVTGAAVQRARLPVRHIPPASDAWRVRLHAAAPGVLSEARAAFSSARGWAGASGGLGLRLLLLSLGVVAVLPVLRRAADGARRGALAVQPARRSGA